MVGFIRSPAASERFAALEAFDVAQTHEAKRAIFDRKKLVTVVTPQNNRFKTNREGILKSAEFWIDKLELTPLPEEGGMYKEVYRSDESIPESALPERFDGSRSFSTSIYYLLKHPEFSAFHRLKQEEIWHFYEGSPLSVHMIDQDGNYFCKRVGRNIDKDETLQLVIYAGWSFAAAVEQAGSYSLIGCTVAPGFEFDDFEALSKNKLIKSYPKHAEVIQKFTRT